MMALRFYLICPFTVIRDTKNQKQERVILGLPTCSGDPGSGAGIGVGISLVCLISVQRNNHYAVQNNAAHHTRCLIFTAKYHVQLKF